MAGSNNEQSSLVVVPDVVRGEVSLGEMTPATRLPVPSAHPAAEYGSLVLSEQQRETLETPIPLDDLDILPTGEVYASQVQYRRRLNRAFGAGGWALIEKTDPVLRDNHVAQKWGLYVRGILIATAWGEQEYFPTNPRMSYATALESAKSNGLMRCCKDLGIASECWDKHFTEPFKAEHCVQVWVSSKKNASGWEKVWRRKDAEPFWNERRDQSPHQPSAAGPASGGADGTTRSDTPPRRAKAPAPPSPKVTPEQQAEIVRGCEQTKVPVEQLCAQFHVATPADLTVDQYTAALSILEARRQRLGGESA